MQLCQVLVFIFTLAITVSAFESKRFNLEPMRLDKRQDCSSFPCTGDLSYCTTSHCEASGYDKMLIAACIDGACYCGFSPDY